MAAIAVAAAVPALGPSAAAARPVPRGFVGAVANAQIVHHPARAASELRVMGRAGVESVKAEFSWARMEPAQGDYAWQETDALVAAAARNGMDVLPTVLGAPGWAAGPEDGKEFVRHPRNRRDYARFMGVLVRRYGPHGSFWSSHPTLPRTPIRAWEIWNEPELYYYWKPPWRKPYVALLRAGRRAVLRADPRAKIVLAGLTYTAWKYVRTLYAAGAGGLFDVVSLHPYTRRPANVVKTMALVRRVLRGHGDGRLPIWVTELSWTSGKGHTHDPSQPNFLNSTPRGQASLLRRGYLALARARHRYHVGRVYWYTWLTRDRSHVDPFDWSGVRRIRGGRVSSKPALRAFRGVARRLEGRRF
jgi:hypothetical protein